MAISNFIWADLSTYKTERSKTFYSTVFNWDLTDSGEYIVAKNKEKFRAGIFEMPENLKKIKMPSFWMSYFQVESTKLAVSQAKALNGKIEVENIRFNNGNIALIRDPQGAGFTVYDGTELHFNEDKSHGSIIATELHISNINNVIPFYSKIFNWKFEKIDSETYHVNSEEKKSNVTIRELSNALKGKYEYWVTTILVDDIKSSTQKIIENGGKLISEEFDRNLLCDNSNEAFFYITKSFESIS